MKRHLTLSILFCAALLQLTAQSVSIEQAREFARRYVAEQPELNALNPDFRLLESSTTAPVVRHMPATVGTSPLFYVLSLSPKGGFVIVAGDERLGPVVACCESGIYRRDDMPEALADWLNAVADRTAALRESTDKYGQSDALRRTGLPTSVEPLIQTQWGQNTPYNMQCPEDKKSGKTCVTGCVATAFAQLLYYHKYPAQGSGTGSYTLDGTEFTESLTGYKFDYNNMLLNYDINASATDTQCKAVATLMKACGLAAKMNYGASASNASGLCYNLFYHFGYDADCRNVIRAQYSDAQWEMMLKTELSEGRPIFYSGRCLTDVTGSSTSGHAFLLDGYNAKGLYHVNWGWSGKYNGYFNLDNLNEKDPNTYSYEGYNYRQGAIIGIQPKTGNPTNPVQNLVTLGLDEYPASCTKGNDVTMNITVQIQDRAFSGRVGLAVYNKDATTPIYSDVVNYEKEQTGIYFYIQPITLTIRNSLSNGTYIVRPVYGGDGAAENTAIPVTANNRDFAPYLIMDISGSQVTFRRPGMASDLQLSTSEVVGRAYQNHNYTLRIKLNNTGSDDFAGEVRLLRNTTVLSTTYVSVPQDETIDAYFRVTAPSTGSEDRLTIQYNKGDGEWLRAGSAYASIFPGTSSDPQLSFSSLSLDKEVYKPGEQATVNAILYNAQGIFEGEVMVWAWMTYLDNGRSSFGLLSRRALTLGTAQSADLSISADLPHYSPGTYRLLITDNTYALQQYLTFTISEGEEQTADLNKDGEVNVGDVTTLVNMILGKVDKSDTADLNKDGDVNVGDVTTLVNTILGK